MLRKLAGETAIYGISSVLGRLLNLILTPFYTNIFKTGQYGIVSYFYSYIAFANVFFTFGMETAFFRFAEDHDDPRKAYNQAFLWVSSLVLILLTLGLLSYRLLAQAVGYGERPELVLMVICIIALDALAALPMAKLRREGRAMRFSVINLVNIGLTLTANFVFIGLLDKGIEYVFVSNIIASALRLLMALPTGLPSSLRPDRKGLGAMAHYGLFIMLAGLAGMMNETLDRILIPNLWPDGQLFNGVPRTGEELTGIYAACYKMSMFIALVTQAFRYAAEPFFFKKAKDKDSPAAFARVFHFFMIAVLGGFLLVSSYDKEIVSFNFFGIFGEDKTFIGKDYWEGLEVVPILLMAYVFSAAYLNLSIWFKITKQTRFAMLFTGIGALITLLVNVLTIPRFGYLGSAWATLAAYGSMSVVCYLLGRRYYPIPYGINRLLAYALIIVGAYFINVRIGPSEGIWWVFMSKFFVCLLAFGAIAFWERVFPKQFSA